MKTLGVGCGTYALGDLSLDGGDIRRVGDVALERNLAIGEETKVDRLWMTGQRQHANHLGLRNAQSRDCM